MTKQLKLGIGLVTASLILLIGVLYFSRAGIKRSINLIRADRLYGQALVAFEAESWGEVVQKGRAAHYLSPDNQDNQLLVAQALLYRRDFSAIDWWKRVLDKPGLPVDDLREMTRNLLKMRMYEEASPFLERLVELDSSNPETQRLWLGALQAQRKVSSTRALAENLVEEGSEDWAVHQRYMQLQQGGRDDEGESASVNHLISLIKGNGALAILAARELALRPNAGSDNRLLAANFILENGEDELDKLLAEGVRVKEGVQDDAILAKLLDDYLEAESAQNIHRALDWLLWMGAPELYLSRVDWTTFRDSGGKADQYFRALMDTGRYQELVDISQSDYSETDPDSISFLAYRAAAQRQLGQAEQADATLKHAVQIVSPEQSMPLERFLLSEGQWDLLVELYATLLEEEPENTGLIYRNLAALYYTGQQDRLTESLSGVDLDLFDGQVSSLSFIGYLKLIVLKFDPTFHEVLESYMSQYPEVYDFRLLVGTSYLLQGKPGFARPFADDMPELNPQAPRHLRVCAALLLNSSKDLFSAAEFEYLMPRERYLLSLVPSE